jgi:hypothetical protein
MKLIDELLCFAQVLATAALFVKNKKRKKKKKE